MKSEVATLTIDAGSIRVEVEVEQPVLEVFCEHYQDQGIVKLNTYKAKNIRAFLEAHVPLTAQLPTKKQLTYAKRLAKDAGIVLPVKVIKNKQACSDFIAKCLKENRDEQPAGQDTNNVTPLHRT